MHVVKIDTVDTEGFETSSASLLAVYSRTVNLVMRHATFSDKSKLGRKKDLISFPSPLEPFRQELLAITIKTVKDWRELLGVLVRKVLLTRSYPS